MINDIYSVAWDRTWPGGPRQVLCIEFKCGCDLCAADSRQFKFIDGIPKGWQFDHFSLSDPIGKLITKVAHADGD